MDKSLRLTFWGHPVGTNKQDKQWLKWYYQ